MGKPIRSFEFNFVPMPVEIWEECVPLSLSEFRFLGYLCKQIRFGEALRPITDEEMMNGVWENGKRKDQGCGLLSRNGIKQAREALAGRGWIDAINISKDPTRPRWNYRLLLGTKGETATVSARQLVSQRDTVTTRRAVSHDDSAVSQHDSGGVTARQQVSSADTCNKEEESTKNLDKELERAGDVKRTRLSPAERDSWDLRRWREEFDKLQGASIGSGNGSDREWLATAKRAAMLAGVTLQRLHELLKPFYPNDPNINRLIEQNPLFPEEQDAARPDEESAEQVQRRMESGKRAGVVFEYVRDYVKARISPHSFDTWIKPLRAVSLDEGVLTLRVPSAEFKQIGEKFGDVLEKAIAGRADDVKFVTDAVEQRATA